MPGTLESRRAFVAGGASGFGLAIARRLADEGATVAIGDRAADRLAEAVELDARLLAIEFDVAERQSVTRAVADTEALLGGLDTVVFSAGVVHVKPLDDVTDDDWDATLDINLKGAFLLAQTAAPMLRASGRGRIVAIASDAGRYGHAWEQAYCASKFGLLGLCQSLAAELAPDAVTVNCVCPSACPTTTMGKELTTWKARTFETSEANVLREIARVSPLGRYATEKDVAAAVAFLVSDGAGFITGAALDVDGGSHLASPAGTPKGTPPGVSSPGAKPSSTSPRAAASRPESPGA